jgi:hypothetical protein
MMGRKSRAKRDRRAGVAFGRPVQVVQPAWLQAEIRQARAEGYVTEAEYAQLTPAARAKVRGQYGMF